MAIVLSRASPLLWAWVCGRLLCLPACCGLGNVTSLYSLPLTFLFLTLVVDGIVKQFKMKNSPLRNAQE